MALWLVRAGSHGEYEKQFLHENRIYLTWDCLSYNLSKIQSKRKLYDLLIETYPDCKMGTLRNWTGQIWSYTYDMQEGDLVVLPSKLERTTVHIAEITGPYIFNKNAENPFFHYHSVRWIVKYLPQSNFDQELRRSFGARQTICRLKRNKAENRVRATVEMEREDGGFGKNLSKESRAEISEPLPRYRFDTSEVGIRNLIKSGETDRVEFKTKLPPDDVIAKTISAFANTNGGIILVGVEDNGGIIGIPQGELELAIESLEKVSQSLLHIPVEVGSRQIDRKPIIYAVIEKPSFEYVPITTARGEAYQRRASADIRLEYPDIRDLMETGLVSKKPFPQLMIVFVAMSFKEEQEPALVDYFKAMERAVNATHLPLRLNKIDLEEGDYEISTQIMQEIDNSHIVIADFTLNSRNVYFELGYARGKDKRVIQTARTDTDLEFDVRSWKTVLYRNATELETKLVPALFKAYQDAN